MPKQKKEQAKEQAKEKIVKAPKVTLTSYTIKATISTGPYSNIQPEITVTAPSIEDANSVVLPQIEALFDKYLNISERQNTPAPVIAPKATPAPEVKKAPEEKVEEKSAVKLEPTEEATAPYAKAKKAIMSCNSIEALNLVNNQISKSTKLMDNEKKALSIYIDQKTKEING